MKVLVCGGRNFGELTLIPRGDTPLAIRVGQRLRDDHFLMMDYLSALHVRTPVTLIIEGGAKGADTAARIWASLSDVPSRCFPADWKSLGRRAGPIRNAQMLAEGRPDLVVAFPGGAGTEGMINLARNAGISVERALTVPHPALSPPG